jgi:hypothetical protein
VRFGAVGRFCVGVAAAVAAVASPWLVGLRAGPILFVLVIALLPVAAWYALRHWPLRGRGLPARHMRWLIPLCFASACFVCAARTNGSTDWFTIGIVYGADKFKGLEVGGASSLAGILQNKYGWAAKSSVQSLAPWPVTISHVLICVYGLCVLAACWAMRRFERIGDKRFLLAMAAPWVVYFAVFPKMHERYLLWGALCGCCAAAVGLAPLLLALFFTLVQLVMSLFQMIGSGEGFLTEFCPDAGPLVARLIRPTFPDIGWAILLAAAVWVWMTMAGAVTRTTLPSVSRVVQGLDGKICDKSREP